MPYRLPDTTLQRAVAAALQGLRSDHTHRLADDVLTVRRGWRIGQILYGLLGLLVLLPALFVFVWWLVGNAERFPWILGGLGVFAGLGLFGVYLGARPAGVTIDRRTRKVQGYGEFRYELDLSPTTRLRLVRSPEGETQGNGSIAFVEGREEHLLLDVDGVAIPKLTQLKVLSMALSAWLDLPLIDASSESASRALQTSDSKVGLALPTASKISADNPTELSRINATDVVITAVELLHNL